MRSMFRGGGGGRAPVRARNLAIAGLLAVAAAAGAHEPIHDVGQDTGLDASQDTREDAGQNAGENATSPGRFRVAVTPYAWLPGFSGDVMARGIEFDINTSLADIIDTSDSAFGYMGAIDFEAGGFVFQINAAWVSAEVENARGVLRNGEVRSDLEFDASWTEAFAGYRLLDAPLGHWGGSGGRQWLTVDAFVGARLTSIDVDTTVTAQSTVTLRDGTVLMAGQSRDQDQNAEWVEPFVGLRAGHDFGNGWSTTIRADVGGFGIGGARFSWQAEALGGYRWQLGGWDVALFGGYRALGQDYSSGGFGWDMVTHGPVVGAQLALRF